MGVVDSVDNRPERQQKLDSLGVSWVRMDFRWSWIEPRRGEWDYGQFDEYLEISNRSRRKVLGILDYETPWLFPPGKTRPEIPPEGVSYFLNYVRYTVSRYKGKVAAWEIWNEPNTPWFWTGSDNDYFILAKLTVDAIREADPDAYILTGATWGVPAGWLRGLRDAGGFASVDGYSFHPYWMAAADGITQMEQARSATAAIGFSGELWVSEVGNPSGGSYPSASTEGEQAANLFRFYTQAAARGMRAAFWYRLAGPRPPSASANSESFFNLVYDDYSEKPAADAYRVFAHTIPGARFAPSALILEGPATANLEVFPFVKDGEIRLAAWSKNGASIALSGQQPLSRDSFGGNPQAPGLVGRDPVLLRYSYEAGVPLVLRAR